MRCGRMRCGDIWRCGGKKTQPHKPAFESIQFWGYDNPLVGNGRTIGIYCQPVVDDEVVITVSDPSKAQFLNVILQRQDEYTKVYEGHFDILSEGSFQVTVASKNNPNLSFTNNFYAQIPVPVETFTFEDQNINVPSGGITMFNATYTPTDAYVWSGLDVRDTEEGDTYASIYGGSSGNLRMYARSYAPEGATRTMVAKHFDEPVGSVEADIIENVLPETAEFTEHSITMTVGETHTMQVTTVPADCTVVFAAQPEDFSIVGNSLLEVYANNPGTTTLHLLDWDTGVEYDTCEVTVEAPVYPTIEFVDGDTEINVGETGTLRFRYTNATSFSDDVDYPLIADVTHISSDGEYCYITYEGASDGVCHISAIAWNGDINISAGVQVTVVGVPLEPVTSINQFSTDYTTIAGKYAMRNLGTVTPSEGADINSIARGMSHELNVQETRIENGTLYAVVFGEEGDWNLYVTLQNGNQYVYTFHIQPDIPVESIEEHFAYNIDVSLGGAVTTEFSYLPTNATNFSGITWRGSVGAEEIAQPGGWRYDNGTLYRNINGIGEGNCTLTGMLNDVGFTTVNVTVDPR